VSKVLKFPYGALTVFALRDQNVLRQEGAKAMRDNPKQFKK
jgi:hypothetical protein